MGGRDGRGWNFRGFSKKWKTEKWFHKNFTYYLCSYLFSLFLIYCTLFSLFFLFISWFIFSYQLNYLIYSSSFLFLFSFFITVFFFFYFLLSALPSSPFSLPYYLYESSHLQITKKSQASLFSIYISIQSYIYIQMEFTNPNSHSVNRSIYFKFIFTYNLIFNVYIIFWGIFFFNSEFHNGWK